MPSPLSILLQSLGERLDEELLPNLYAAASAPTAEIREWLRAQGLPFQDAEAGLWPTPDELETSAERVISSARDRAVAVGVVSGLVGAAAIPPEVLLSVVASLRLAQRLAVVFGFDPETDAGKLVLWRALAAAWNVELPTQGPVGMKVHQLPQLFRGQVPAQRHATAWLARQVVTRAASAVVGRISRAVPGLGAGIGGLGARRRTLAMGKKMIAVYRRAMAAEPFDLTGEELAVEVG
jgi:hypothetical protein